MKRIILMFLVGALFGWFGLDQYFESRSYPPVRKLQSALRIPAPDAHPLSIPTGRSLS